MPRAFKSEVVYEIDNDEVGVTREAFFEWLYTCPLSDQWVLIEDDFGYCRVVFCFDEKEHDD